MFFPCASGRGARRVTMRGCRPSSIFSRRYSIFARHRYARSSIVCRCQSIFDIQPPELCDASRSRSKHSRSCTMIAVHSAVAARYRYALVSPIWWNSCLFGGFAGLALKWIAKTPLRDVASHQYSQYPCRSLRSYDTEPSRNSRILRSLSFHLM